MARSNSCITCTQTGSMLKFDVELSPPDSEQKDVRSIEIDSAQLNDAIRESALMHGLRQKIQDAAAVSADKATGKTSPHEKLENMQAVIANLLAGNWNVRASRGGGDKALLLEALLLAKPDGARVDFELFLESRTAEEIRAMLGAKQLAPIVASLRAKRNGGRGEDLLSGLLG